MLHTSLYPSLLTIFTGIPVSNSTSSSFSVKNRFKSSGLGLSPSGKPAVAVGTELVSGPGKMLLVENFTPVG